ncbi:MAG: MerR family DNA-binding transcriptional regulator [Candidatus Daviesbacteria bacterium]|nr:MerR family DNA-binding transcriptional regulator [Candidatus Daviesbacteria bacterium]
MSDSLPKHNKSLPIDSIKGKKLIPISEAAKVLGVSIDTVRRWDKSGFLHSERPDGKNRYFALDELEKHKLSQPLPISEVAKKAGISPTTLRRLEAKGLIKPKRNNAGERVYDEDLLKNFLNSDYFLRRKQIEEKIIEDLQEEKELIDSTLESETEHIEKNVPQTEPTIPHINLKPRSSLPNFLAISTAMFLLLFTLGIGNIKLTEAKSYQSLSTPSATVLGESKVVENAPVEAVGATSEVTLTTKITVVIKTEDGSSTVNIRQKPTTKSAKVAQAKDNDNFELVSKDAGWYEVKLADASTGFISEKYVVAEGTNN